MVQGFASSPGELEVIFSYSAAQQTVFSNATEEGWQVVGAFTPDQEVGAKIEITGQVSTQTTPALVLSARIFQVSPVVEEVTGSNGGQVRASLSTLLTKTSRSQISAVLAAGSTYQMQVKVQGGTGSLEEFGVANSVQLVV